MGMIPGDATAPKRRGRPPSGGRESIIGVTLALLQEQGVSRFTTKEVARRAQVSEASIFYHFKDRAGLLLAVFAEGLRPLAEYGGALHGGDHRTVLLTMSRSIETFLTRSLPVLTAAQADRELGDALRAYMAEGDLGPHRGVRAIAGYLREEQRAGRVGADVDVTVIGAMVVSVCFTRASQRLMLGHTKTMPSLERVVDTVVAIIEAGAGPG